MRTKRNFISYIAIFSIGSVLALAGCHSVMNTASSLPAQKDSIILLPETEIPLPSLDFAFLFPEAPELNKPVSPRKSITEDFSRKELTDIAVGDPLLMAEENTMIIDLGLIQNEEVAFPLPGAKLISDYAGRRRNHTGVDLKTKANDQIVSAFDGIVRISKSYYGYGNVIVVRHYNGLETLYSHNSKNLVKAGDKVKAGDVIALTGRTGRATTDHLHFEVRVNGQHFNPNMIFDFQNGRLNEQCLLFTKSGNKINVKPVELMPHQLADNYNYKDKFLGKKGS